VIEKLENLSKAQKKLFRSDEARWIAVKERDRTADGLFFYAVLSTGIYCRPGCPARGAKRENLRFFETAAAAESVGFRACKRCNPKGSALDEKLTSAIADACTCIQESSEPVDVRSLAERAGLSESHFHRAFKRITGLTPKAFGNAHRAERARNMLAKGTRITQSIYDAGFNSSSRFYEKSNSMLGMQPNQFQKGGQGTRIQFAVGDCSLGKVLVASTERGVCALFMGNDAGALEENLRKRFPRADIRAGDESFRTVLAEVIRYVDAPGSQWKLPLELRGTAFQHAVWKALQEIPPGKTSSYAEVARRIGKPASVRAVAQACGANPVALAVPCHRVLRSDGDISGYRWGVERKKALLEREKLKNASR
jgi:AraC family transcriptional regulator of adaptative response/methylated-DNA-[protein]-cysteine methyltransferase